MVEYLLWRGSEKGISVDIKEITRTAGKFLSVEITARAKLKGQEISNAGMSRSVCLEPEKIRMFKESTMPFELMFLSLN